MPDEQWCLHCGEKIRRGPGRRWVHIASGLHRCIAETEAEPGLD